MTRKPSSWSLTRWKQRPRTPGPSPPDPSSSPSRRARSSTGTRARGGGARRRRSGAAGVAERARRRRSAARSTRHDRPPSTTSASRALARGTGDDMPSRPTVRPRVLRTARTRIRRCVRLADQAGARPLGCRRGADAASPFSPRHVVRLFAVGLASPRGRASTRARSSLSAIQILMIDCTVTPRRLASRSATAPSRGKSTLAWRSCQAASQRSTCRGRP